MIQWSTPYSLSASEVPDPKFITDIEANTALETPQILVNWDLIPVVYSTIDPTIEWKWTSMILNRSDVRLPESTSDGTTIHLEAYSSIPSTYFADTTVSGMMRYYYSLFFQYIEHSSSTLQFSQPIERLGTDFVGCCAHIPDVMMSGTNGTTNIGSDKYTVPVPPLGFIDKYVCAGDILQISDGGADDGYYTVVSVDTNLQVTISSALTLHVVGTSHFSIYSNHYKFWIAGTDFNRDPMLWRYDSKSQLVDLYVNLSSLLNTGESVKAIASANDITGHIAIVTNSRYIRFLYTTEVPTSTDIVKSWTLPLDPGFVVIGAAYKTSTTAVYVLDAKTSKIKVITEATGVVSATIDISNLAEVTSDTLHGLSYDSYDNRLFVANRNYVYSFSPAVATPVNSDVKTVTYTRNLILSDIACYNDLFTKKVYAVVVVNTLNLFQSYEQEVCRGYLWQQPFVSDEKTVALYHLEESAGAVIDSSSLGYNGTNHGMTVRATGKFTYGYTATLVANYIDIIAMAASFSVTEGSASLWFKVTDVSSFLSGGSLLLISTDANNYIAIYVDGSGNLIFAYYAGGTAKSVSSVHPNPDTEWHNYKITWTKAGDALKAYFDGVQFGATVGGLGVWAGGLVKAVVGGGAANTLLGTYDEVRISKISRDVPVPVTSTTDANGVHALSGRDYATVYVKSDKRGFFYRDEIYTAKFQGGDFLIRNDFERMKLWPPNKIASDGSVVNRDTTLPVLGDMGRLSRLVGLLLDRIADDRDVLLWFLNPYLCDPDYHDVLAHYLGIPGLDMNWNIDKRQRYLDLMKNILKKAGRINSYKSYARLLDFIITESTLYARRKWDSVRDPNRANIYLDQMGSMDTYNEKFPLSILRFSLFKSAFSSDVGVTSIPASRVFTDATAHFKETASIGSLLKIYDISTGSDNGEYLVVSVISDTQLLVDINWPVGSLVGLTYTINWKITHYDPYMIYLLKRFVDDIAPDPMRITYLE
jgi:hypothetical protein